jgi:hypothetical protein
MAGEEQGDEWPLPRFYFSVRPGHGSETALTIRPEEVKISNG